MILLRDLKGGMEFDSGKATSVHVPTDISYDFNALTAVVWNCGAHNTCVVSVAKNDSPVF
jgi:hypothetical protein